VATWVIGDVQGAFEPVSRLLGALDYQPARDRLIFAGDLVNRGPESARVLRWCKDQGESVTAVLGNHDIHLLACAQDPSRVRAKDTLGDVLDAPDREELVAWLAARPLWIDALDHVIVHAAVHPAWTMEQGRTLAREVSAALRGPQGDAVLSHWRSGTGRWDPDAAPLERMTSALATLTRMRLVTSDLAQDFSWSGPLEGRPEGLEPWFRAGHRGPHGPTICFGHWARLGHHIEPGIVALDSGAVYGRQLTAYCLDDRRVIQVDGYAA